jgi:hypothetical protein
VRAYLGEYSSVTEINFERADECDCPILGEAQLNR